MKSSLKGLLAVALTLIVSSPLRAESELTGKLRQRIELDLADAAPADVFATFAKMLGAELELSSAVSGRISVRLQNVTAETALGAICESIGCRSELEWGDKPLLRILPIVAKTLEPQREALRQSLDSPMSISLKDATAMDVLVSLSRLLEAELQVQAGTTQTVTLELQGVPARQALDAVSALIRMDWDLREATVDGKIKRILRISPRKPIFPVPATPAVKEKR
ncbi:MAG: hypothetical protein ABIV06_10575 [Thermoanaerobaculia bacterium]